MASDYHEQRLVEDLTAFIDTLRLGTVSLVAFSFGGRRREVTRRSTRTA
jgi:hypothetical protein